MHQRVGLSACTLIFLFFCCAPTHAAFVINSRAVIFVSLIVLFINYLPCLASNSDWDSTWDGRLGKVLIGHVKVHGIAKEDAQVISVGTAANSSGTGEGLPWGVDRVGSFFNKSVTNSESKVEETGELGGSGEQLLGIALEIAVTGDVSEVHQHVLEWNDGGSEVAWCPLGETIAEVFDLAGERVGGSVAVSGGTGSVNLECTGEVGQELLVVEYWQVFWYLRVLIEL